MYEKQLGEKRQRKGEAIGGLEGYYLLFEKISGNSSQVFYFTPGNSKKLCLTPWKSQEAKSKSPRNSTWHTSFSLSPLWKFHFIFN